MLLQRSVESTGRSTVEAKDVALRREDRETSRIVPWVRADCHVGAVFIAAESLRAKVTLAVLAGTDRSALVLRNGVLLACHSLVSPGDVFVCVSLVRY